MDLLSPFLQTDAASPRLTTYTDAGRMELSAATLANWAAKGGNLMAGQLGLFPGDVVVLDARTDWMPAALVVGCWRAGVAVCSPSSPASASAAALMTTDPGAHPDWDAEILQLSTDPFGRGVAEAGGDVEFGVTDLSPELRVQGDRYTGPETGEDTVLLHTVDGEPVTGADLRRRASEIFEPGTRSVTGPWADTDGLVATLLPLFVAGSVVVSTDDAPERLKHLAATELGAVTATRR